MIRLLTDGKNLIIDFKYDPDVVSRVKSLPNRTFDPVSKKWILPLTINDFFEFRKTFPLSEIDKSVREFDFDKKEEPVLSYEPPRGLTPYRHQIETFKFMVSKKRAAVFNTMGTGKTITALMSLDYLFKNNLIKKALIVAPLLVINDAWMSDVELFPGLKIERLTKEEVCAEEGISIINWDMLKILYDYVIEKDPVTGKESKRVVKTFDFDFDCVILDESAKVRNVKTKRFEILKRYMPPKYAFILSGLPAPNTPLEYWPQFYLMDGGVTLGNNYRQFLNKYAYKTKYDHFITKQGSIDIKNRVVAKSIRYELEDCVDLPENIAVWREVELDSTHLSNYFSIEENTNVMIETGEINASNSAVKTIKLQQAASGYVYDDEGRSIALTNNNKKIKALIEIIREEFGMGQVVVYAYFRNQIDAVTKALQEEFKTRTVFGGGADNRRAVEDFKSGSAQVLIANPASVGTGMNFTNAKGIIWFAPIWDYEIFDQSRSRVHRIGLDHKSIEVFMHAKGTIEYSMYWGLRHKKDLSAIILRSIKEKNKTKRLQGIYR